MRMKQLLAQKNILWSVLFLLAVIFEMMLHSSNLALFGMYGSPWAIISVAVFMVFAAYRLIQPAQIIPNKTASKKEKAYKDVVLYILLSMITGYIFYRQVLSVPIDPLSSDIIPTLQTYNRRLLHGQYVYDLIPYTNYHVVPNYLTMQWLPYIIAELLHIDYRLYGLFFYLVACAWMLYKIPQYPSIQGIQHIKNIFPFFPVWMYLLFEKGVFTMSIEQIVVVYYMFFAMALFSKRWWILALALALCLWSRFSIVYWLPFFVVYAFVQFKKNQAIGIGIFVFLFGLIVYVLPFMIHDPTIFTRGVQYYVDAAPYEWVQKGWQQASDPPFHLSRGLGFNIYFNDFWKGSLTAKIAACRHFQLVICMMWSLISAYLVFRKQKTIPAPWLALFSLKIYMVLFYQFIQVPYVYLQWVNIAVSIVLVWQLPLFVTPQSQQS